MKEEETILERIHKAHENMKSQAVVVVSPREYKRIMDEFFPKEYISLNLVNVKEVEDKLNKTIYFGGN